MKLIQTLSERIEEEIKDAKWYIQEALLLKDEYPDVSRVMYNISTQEVDHMNMLHDAVVMIIKEYRATKGEPPSTMMAVYEYLHKKQIERYGDVRNLIEAYKNS